MELFLDFIRFPFVWGLGIGLALMLLAMWSHFKTRREFSRFRRHLSDKLELEAKQYELVRKEKEKLAKENENLRMQVATLNENPDNKILREVEILARAERQLMISAPGFGAAWETAKAHAVDEIQAEEQGKSLPKRIFRKFFSTPGNREMVAALPSSAEIGFQEGQK
jgi:cell division protein FtsB